MIRRVVLDGAPGGLAARLGPSVVEGAGDGPGTLYVTESADRARAEIGRGSAAWVIGPAGELDAWDDLPLALALGRGGIGEVREIVGERLRAQGLALASLAWTPDGSAAGEAGGRPVLVVGGPDGENPQVLVGAEAEAMARGRAAYLDALRAQGAVAEGALASGRTHTLRTTEGDRPRLERRRFSATGE